MPVFVVANAVRAIDSAIQDVIDASRNLNVETSTLEVIPERGIAPRNAVSPCCIVSVSHFLDSVVCAGLGECHNLNELWPPERGRLANV